MLDKNAIQEIYNKSERTAAEDFIYNTLEDIEYIKNRFVVIGYRLVEAVKNDYVFDFGYSDITDLAEDVFGIKKSMTYALMNISKYFCVGMELRDNYKCFNQSQLIEIAQSPAYLQSSITSDMTVQDIRDYRKILSGFKTYYKDIYYMGNAKKIVDTYREDKRIEEETKKNLEFFQNSGCPENSGTLENCEQTEFDVSVGFSTPLYLLQWFSADGEFMYAYSSESKMLSAVGTFPTGTKFRVLKLSSMVRIPPNEILSKLSKKG